MRASDAPPSPFALPRLTLTGVAMVSHTDRSNVRRGRRDAALFAEIACSIPGLILGRKPVKRSGRRWREGTEGAASSPSRLRGHRGDARQHRSGPPFRVSRMGSRYSPSRDCVASLSETYDRRAAAKQAASARSVRGSRSGRSVLSICSQRVATSLFCIVATMVAIGQVRCCKVLVELSLPYRVHEPRCDARATGAADDGHAAVNAAAAALTRSGRRPVQRQGGTQGRHSGDGHNGGGSSDGRGCTEGGQRLCWWESRLHLDFFGRWRCGGGAGRLVRP